MAVEHAYATTIPEFQAAQAAGIPVQYDGGIGEWQDGHWLFLKEAKRYRIAPSHSGQGVPASLVTGFLAKEAGLEPPALVPPQAPAPGQINPKFNSAIKYDDGKADISLLPPEALLAIAEVFTFGAKKYAPDNWRGGFVWRRVVSAILRHLFAWLAGQDKDPETGLSHIAHVGCNVMFLLTFIITKTGTDDRFKTYKE